jgi:hypothetical protein
MQVTPSGIQLSGNPTGSGVSHLFIKPNLNILGNNVAGGPRAQPSNVQFSVGDGKKTATEQLQVLILHHAHPVERQSKTWRPCHFRAQAELKVPVLHA